MEQIVCLILTVCLVKMCAAQCPEGWTHFQEDCLVLDIHKTTWILADSYCKSFDSHLVAIETQKEDLNILAYLKLKQYSDPVWTDGNDLLVSGQWQWAASSKLLTYTNWASGEPDSETSQMCVALVHDVEYNWRTRDCGDTNAFICQKKATYTNKPTKPHITG